MEQQASINPSKGRESHNQHAWGSLNIPQENNPKATRPSIIAGQGMEGRTGRESKIPSGQPYGASLRSYRSRSQKPEQPKRRVGPEKPEKSAKPSNPEGSDTNKPNSPRKRILEATEHLLLSLPLLLALAVLATSGYNSELNALASSLPEGNIFGPPLERIIAALRDISLVQPTISKLPPQILGLPTGIWAILAAMGAFFPTSMLKQLRREQTAGNGQPATVWASCILWGTSVIADTVLGRHTTGNTLWALIQTVGDEFALEAIYYTLRNLWRAVPKILKGKGNKAPSPLSGAGQAFKEIAGLYLHGGTLISLIAGAAFPFAANIATGALLEMMNRLHEVSSTMQVVVSQYIQTLSQLIIGRLELIGQNAEKNIRLLVHLGKQIGIPSAIVYYILRNKAIRAKLANVTSGFKKQHQPEEARNAVTTVTPSPLTAIAENLGVPRHMVAKALPHIGKQGKPQDAVGRLAEKLESLLHSKLGQHGDVDPNKILELLTTIQPGDDQPESSSDLRKPAPHV